MGRRQRHRDHSQRALEGAVWRAVAAVHAGGASSAVYETLALHGGAVGVVQALLDDSLAEVTKRGWSHDDLRHVVARKLSARHAVMPPLGGESRRGAQPAADELRRLIELLAVVTVLPDLPDGDAGVGRSDHRGLDPRIVRRVRALLTKAESTDFPEEAEALTAKAQELIARHAIDAVAVDGEGDDGPESRRVYLDDPYVDAKSALLGAVAGANRCSAVFAPAFAWCTVFGYTSDLDAVELLFESLLAQAAHALALEGSRVDARGRSRTKSFRRSFLYGFAHRIGQRLAEATQAQVALAGATNDRLLPALAARDERVLGLQRATYPSLQRRSVSVSNGAGWAAGRAAADVADLTVGRDRVGRGG